jgi:uncharacterized protein with HEPN domain
MRRERLYLDDILAAADAVTGFIEKHTWDSFAANLMLRSAVVHQMTVIGEAVSRLSPELRGGYPGTKVSATSWYTTISVSIGSRYGVRRRAMCRNCASRSPKS